MALKTLFALLNLLRAPISTLVEEVPPEVGIIKL
jgi:hypothetical protein